MHTLHTILLLVYILVCCVLTVIVLMQEGKQAGLTGAISGAAETYWGKNKGRSMEGGLELATRILAVVFVVLSLILNLKIFQ
ncbi:preprotein translocase subunit SecG [Clostridium sp. OM05-6BH]|uniref:preprotein translocase subunit SecG n=1 Tax=Butyribacter sp. TaxID=2822465 RepID=UPI000E47862A|nr:preprotein translocase subunit SecG [Clostridium sp. AM49-4BH]RHV11350.1 preprotein translocase subunit SecG [Clostridium sp. OM05-9BH]RHV17320.1 preprotein translocase subunit SecG [Clostridium sp. OM05-6BH]HCK45177.1 preprotein translocase subunit SecG [Lachnospiraceae bacterium]